MLSHKKRSFRTFVLTRGIISGIISAVLGIGGFLLLLMAVLFLASQSGEFGTAIIDRYFGNNAAYAEVVEIFTDSEGRVSAIMGSYTRLVSNQKTPNPTPMPTVTPTPEQTPPKIIESTSKSLADLKNQSGKAVDTSELVAAALPYKIESDRPQVLIVHTHTTESYQEQDRSVDETKNMTAIGAAIAERLNSGGIQTIHDTTVHDYPSYSGAYTRSAATTKSRLSENPGIKIVLDVHRDAIAADDGSKLKLSTNINGESVAQIMFVVGTDAELTHENWQDNLTLALKLQQAANRMYPGLMRPINLRAQRFNQQLSRGSIIIEVGTNGNTLEEALRGAQLIGDVIANVLSENKA